MATDDRTEETHPSYGSIRLGRVTGGDGRLFMSPLRHSSRITISIQGARLVRHLNNDTHYPNAQEIIEVEMSEQQFAQFVCSGGAHEGAPPENNPASHA